VGILVGAVTLGSSGPHLVRWAVPAEHWRWVLLAAAASSFAGSLLILGVPHDGPHSVRAAAFSWGAVPRILRDRAILLANGGYLGHMWELYALWTWIAVWTTESEAVRTGSATGAVGAAGALAAFGVIGSGALGCALAGVAADRWGRTRVTALAMAVSGGCAALAGFVFGRPIGWMLPLLLVWGMSAVADSAQFSTAVSELAPPDLVGSALTLQTCLGFLLTTASIHLLPTLASGVGWRWVMVALVPGPALGIAAMLALRRRPEAVRLAGGRR
jgi:MFS family permease